VSIARESRPYLIAGLSVAVASLALGFYWLGGAAVALSGFVAFFFRDPDRIVPEDPDLLVCPGDGRVTEVRDLGAGQGIRVSVFLSLFDVHINRSPAAGRIERVEYRPGRFLPANGSRAAVENERNDIQLSTAMGPIRFAQIAGVVARRIVLWKQAGDPVALGERIGLIQFGSRVEIILPPGVDPMVEVGARVKGGSTVLARAARSGQVSEARDFAQASRG
jgi:phosphatidylserine decarboxylase